MKEMMTIQMEMSQSKTIIGTKKYHGVQILIQLIKGKNTKKMYKKCLGVFACSELDCNFVSQVKTNVKKNCGFHPLKTACKSHPDRNLKHILCQAKIVMTSPIGKQCVVIKNNRYHSHPLPPKIQPAAKALKQFEDILKNAPEATPLHLSVGNKMQSPVSELGESLGNIDQVRYYSRHVCSEKPQSLISES